MAENLASLFGTERDRVNCPFYHKIGVCRHGTKCSRKHHKPTISPTVLLLHMYPNPFAGQTAEQLLGMNVAEAQQQFENFYEDVFAEMSKFGEVDEMHVCDNLNDHMVGNVYVKFVDEAAAKKAVDALAGRFYAGRPVHPEFNPVTDFREAKCRQFELGECNRGGFCNFLHVRRPPPELLRKLYKAQARTLGVVNRREGEGGGGEGQVEEQQDERDRKRHHRKHHHRHSHKHKRERSRSGSATAAASSPSDRSRSRSKSSRSRSRSKSGARRGSGSRSRSRSRSPDQAQAGGSSVGAEGGRPEESVSGLVPSWPPRPPALVLDHGR